MLRRLFVAGMMLGCAIPLMAWSNSGYGVTVSATDLYDSSGWKYGASIEAYNGNSYTVNLHPYMSTYDNVRWSLSQVYIAPGNTVSLGWVSCADSQNSWNYRMGWNINRAGFQSKEGKSSPRAKRLSMSTSTTTAVSPPKGGNRVTGALQSFKAKGGK